MVAERVFEKVLFKALFGHRRYTLYKKGVLLCPLRGATKKGVFVSENDLQKG